MTIWKPLIIGPNGRPLEVAGLTVPEGGTTGQVLAKNSNTNFDTEWVDPGGGGVAETPRAKRVDFVGDTLIYVGEADPGTAESAASWRISKIDTTLDISVLWADGNNNYDNVWNDRLSLSYS